MTFPKARLVVSACLFSAWLGFLLYLVLDSNTIVLSKPQFLVAQLYVVADIGNSDGAKAARVTINEVLWSADPADAGLAKRAVEIPGIPDLVRNEGGYDRPGKYLLPLVKTARGSYLIAPMPRTAHPPGLRIYPWTAGTKAQLEEIIQARAK